jgi:hypothetical protein
MTTLLFSINILTPLFFSALSRACNEAECKCPKSIVCKRQMVYRDYCTYYIGDRCLAPCDMFNCERITKTGVMCPEYTCDTVTVPSTFAVVMVWGSVVSTFLSLAGIGCCFCSKIRDMLGRRRSAERERLLHPNILRG